MVKSNAIEGAYQCLICQRRTKGLLYGDVTVPVCSRKICRRQLLVSTRKSCKHILGHHDFHVHDLYELAQKKDALPKERVLKELRQTLQGYVNRQCRKPVRSAGMAVKLMWIIALVRAVLLPCAHRKPICLKAVIDQMCDVKRLSPQEFAAWWKQVQKRMQSSVVTGKKQELAVENTSPYGIEGVTL